MNPLLIFLCACFLYLLGIIALLGKMRKARATFPAALLFALLVQLAALCLISVVALATGAALWLLSLMPLFLYHAMLGGPLFLLTALLLLRTPLLPAQERRHTRWSVALGGAILALAALAFWSTQIEPHWLAIEHTTITTSSARTHTPPLRIAVVADLQTDAVTPFERHVIDELLALSPDLILFPGDLYDQVRDDDPVDVAAFRTLLARVDAPLGAYMVVGDHDDLPTLREIVRGTPVRLLEDERVALQHGERQIELLGLSAPALSPQARAPFEQLTRQADPHVTRLVLVHRPRFVMELEPDAPVDLVIGGHTHGGQVRLPLFGPPITLSPLPRDIAAGGLHHYQGHAVYVSRGVGGLRSVPLVRFNCRPELSLLTLE